jgi:glucan-binding YG repeat protein
MTKFLILNTFKKIIDDRRSFVVFKSGEEYSLDALSVYFNDKSIESLIETNHIQKLIQNTEIDLNPIETTQIDVSSQDTSTVDTSAQDNDNAQNVYLEIAQEVPVLDNKQNVSLEIASQPIQDIDTQDNTQPQVFEIMYKITQPIQDKDGNEIEVGSQFTESELKELIVVDQRKSNKKIKELLQDEKLIELKIVK